MQLYSASNSPFGARVTLAVRAKGVDVKMLPLPAGGLRSEEFLAINPAAKIPVMITDEGAVIPESSCIVRYIEDRFPEPSLFPADPDRRARINMAARLADLYVMAPVIRLFPQLDPAARDIGTVEQEVRQWRAGLQTLAHFMRKPLPAAPAGLSFADCLIVPALHLSTRIAAMLDLSNDPATEHSAIADYFRRMSAHALIGPVLDRLTEAQEEKDVKNGLPSLAHYHRKQMSNVQ